MGGGERSGEEGRLVAMVHADIQVTCLRVHWDSALNLFLSCFSPYSPGYEQA